MPREVERAAKSDRYLAAAERVPAGETRSFAEVAAAAGRPGAARAVGRALGAVPVDSPLAWHRVVGADGALARDPERAAEQLRRLRREGARPRRGEDPKAWARRRKLAFVGSSATRRLYPANEARVARLDAERVEGFFRLEDALARRFCSPDSAREAAAVFPPRSPARVRARAAGGPSVAARVDALDWDRITAQLRERGAAHVPRLLRAGECAGILGEATSTARFERSVQMESRGFGAGSYHYWKEPLPTAAEELRAALYARLAPSAPLITSRRARFPATLAGFWRRCRAAGQRRSSSILLCYGPGGVNHPHRDLYGPVWFPLQALVVLVRRGRDFQGGEFVLWTEQPGGELHALEIAADRGDLVLFASARRSPEQGRRALPVFHGMRPVTHGARHALGIAFHLAR